MRLLIILLVLAGPVLAQSHISDLSAGSDPRGAPRLTVCSQNLENYGMLDDIKARVPGTDEESFAEKEASLAQRMAAAKCDVIAMQEVIGRDVEIAEKALEKLGKKLRFLTGRLYEAHAGPSNDPSGRTGYLVARDKAEVLNSLSYVKVELPKISDKQKPRLFTRGPYELQLMVKASQQSPAKAVTLIDMHFKSKRGGPEDPAALEWETHRMEMAEALRRVVEQRHAAALSSGESILIVLGDRNSNFDVASAKILEGSLTLRHFQEKGPCRMSKRGVPLCQAGSSAPQRLFSVLTADPQTKLNPGTFKFKKEYSWLDDILLPAESLRFAWAGYDTPGDYDSGVIYSPKAASDHALVYVRLYW